MTSKLHAALTELERLEKAAQPAPWRIGIARSPNNILTIEARNALPTLVKALAKKALAEIVILKAEQGGDK